jgi:hypothetical protein
MLEITRAKLIDNGNGGMEITYSETTTAGRKIKYPKAEFTDVVHPELKAAFDALAPHAALIFGIVKKEDVKDINNPDPALFAAFQCHIYNISGKGELPGVILSGAWNSEHAGHNNFNTRFRLFGEKPESRYCFMDDLVAKLDYLDKKIRKYMAGEEVGVKQLDMYDQHDKEKVTKAQILKPGGDGVFKEPVKNETGAGGGKPAKPAGKGGRKKKVAQSAAAPSGEVDEHDNE